MTFRMITLGCKVNQYETQALEQLLIERGLTPCKDGERAGIYIVNTCAVTAESCRKSRQAVRRADEGAIVAVCGCWPQIEAQEAEKLGVDLVSGSADRHGFVDALMQVVGQKTASAPGDGQPEGKLFSAASDDAENITSQQSFEFLPAGVLSGRTRAMLKVQDGCDNFCAYCVIPYARGRSRSLPIENAAAEARRLQDAGVKEIIITGIEISSYGKDLGAGVRLIDLLEAISAAAPGPRLHLGSLEPRTITEAFCRRLAGLNVCPHFHLSLQSGCDETLRRMGRRYDTARYAESVALLRESFPNCGITTDVIAGFPGETEDEFLKTLAFVKKCAFSSMHIFPYSARKGTRAALMEGQVAKSVKKDRMRRLISLAQSMKAEFLQAQVGQTLQVLFESGSGGHAENACEVEIGGTAERGALLPVRISKVYKDLLLGDISG